MAECISNEDWDIMKAHYIREFDKYTKLNGMELDIEWLEGMLNKSWEMWNNGAYSTIDKFIEALDLKFQDFSTFLNDKDT
jgi:hypothetical protein|tara:strand:+ start:321 stop:560 length:240 start_codon:yes stop_codon:yes gene_type:complete